MAGPRLMAAPLCQALSGDLLRPAGWGSHSTHREMEVLRDKTTPRGWVSAQSRI